MRLRCSALGAATLPLALAHCAGIPSQPGNTPVPSASIAHRSSAAGLSLPPTSSVPAASASVPAQAGVSTSPLSLVLASCDWRAGNSDAAYPFDGGAVLVSRSLIAVVAGDTIRQDPAWLSGLPEFVNWDANTMLFLPPAPAGGLDLPQGTILGVSAGNLHGLGATRRWNGRRWVDAVEPLDPRVAASGGLTNLETSTSLGTGHLFVVRTEHGRTSAVRRVYVFAPGAAQPAKYSLPVDENDTSYALSLAIVAPTLAFLCAIPTGISRFHDGVWSSLELPGATPESCAATADGSLWMVAKAADGHERSLRRFSASGVWETVAMPPGASPQKVWAKGARLWVSAEPVGAQDVGHAGRRFELYSNIPVREPIEVGELQVPVMDVNGITGADVDTVDVPSVSVSPPGPGTRACSALVVYLGKTLSPELGAALAKHPDLAGRTLLHVAGNAPGKVQWRRVAGRSVGSLKPSGRMAAAVAVVPATFDQGMRLVKAIASEVSGSAARLLCAVPNVRHSEPVAQGASQALAPQFTVPAGLEPPTPTK